MPRRFGSQPEDGPEPANTGSSDALTAIDALYNLEMQANLLALRHQRRKERVQRSLAQWAEYWPMALGMLISVFAPQMREFVEAYRPWGLWVSFPMVAITMRPELHMSSAVATMLPTVMLYLQFPLEGLLAKVARRA